MKPEDVFNLEGLGDPRVSPDGRWVAFTVSGFNEEKNQGTSRIWLTAAKTDGQARPFTSGDNREARPRWSGDGRSIAFVSHRKDKGCELCVIPLRGGESKVVAEFPEEIEELAWSPDGSRIAVLVRDQDKATYEKEKPKDQPSRRIDRLIYRLDNVGWTVDRHRHVFVVDANSGETTQLTSGPFEDAGLAWSPDGERISFASARHETWDFDRITDLFVIPSKGGEPERMTDTASSYSVPSWSPEDSMIAFGWYPTPMNSPRNGRIGVLEAETREVRILTEDLDRNCTPLFAAREPAWADGYVYFVAEDSGNQPLYRVAADGLGKPELVHGDGGMVVGFDIAGGTLACVTSYPTRPSVLTLEIGKERRQSEVAVPADSSFDKEVELLSPVEFTATSPDGSEVQAWLMKPAGFQEGHKYPMLFNIHGGPFSQYGNKFFDEFQIYAGAGYVVVYSNPRGSSGYSEEWGRAIRGPKNKEDPGAGWGAVDFDDLMAVVDEALVRFPFIDPDRIGVMGGSYGGFMTSWIIGHTDRFKAAVSERAVNNQITMCWTSDIGPYFRSYFGLTYLEDPEEYLRMSPISYVDNVKTPVLILHSENDLRCPISQAEELFTALKLLGREVEFVRFPGESHELSRSGAPAHRVERFKIILDWFERKLV